jgi:gamma-glutamylcyclotransferase (GGCT)/AIG2-like uncharacterized protein YtfP
MSSLVATPDQLMQRKQAFISRSRPRKQREWMQLPFFVYGTLRPGQSNYERLLQGTTISELPARLEGLAMYSMGAFPVLLPGQPEQSVYGNLLLVHPLAYGRVRRNLDALEGVDPQASEAQQQRALYQRQRRQVQLANGSAAWAWVYVGNAHLLATYAPAPIFSGDWLLHCAQHPR